jgi:hypothetical protein
LASRLNATSEHRAGAPLRLFGLRIASTFRHAE